VALAIAALVAIVVALVVVRGRRQTPSVIATARRPLTGPSTWVLPPKLTSLPAPSAPPEIVQSGSRALRVCAEDVTGGAIPGARVRTEGSTGAEVGVTSESGCLTIDAVGLPPFVRVAVRAEGYAEDSALTAAPGEVSVRLLPLSRVAGRVVERGTRRPVAGVTVSCDGHEATSADDGAFTLIGVSPGRHRIEARADSWAGLQAEPFSLGPAEVVRDLVIEVTRAFVLSGRVLAHGQAAPGREVQLSFQDGSERAAATDGGGQYRHTGLLPGQYRVHVLGKDTLRTILKEPVVIADRDVVFDVDLGTRERLVFEMIDRAGRPVAGMQAHVNQTHDGDQISTGCLGDANGACAVSDLWPGPITYGTRTTPEEKTSLPRNGPVRIVVDDLGGLRGQLIRADGRPVGARYVVLYPLARGQSASATSDDQGHFEIPRLAADDYGVEVYLRNGICAHTPVEATTRVSVARGRTTEVTLQVASGSAAIGGTVLDEAGQPMPDALVTYDYFDPHLVGEDSFRRGLDLTSSDGAGLFHFTDVLQHYRYSLGAYTRDGRLAVADDVAAGDGAVVLHLQRLADLTVEVSGFADPAVTVDLQRGDRTETFRFGGGQGATYHFDNLRPGPIVVTAQSGRESARTSLRLESGRPARAHLAP
jgi:hypothetical protein